MKDARTVKDNLVADLRKFIIGAGFTDVVFGLSGGMDSALVLALAVEALGAQHVHTYMMTTKYTSKLSIDLADEIAKNFGNPHDIIDIQPLVDEFEKTLTFAPARGVTMENVQSRIRGMLCMTYSNEFNWMVLACGNKSEAGVGYCTLYGDTNGAIMPLGDLYKTEVYELAELYPQIPRQIITRPATAELADGQADTDSLPPYAVLDAALRRIEAGMDTDADATIKKKYNGAAFKRIQMPPVLKVRGN